MIKRYTNRCILLLLLNLFSMHFDIFQVCQRPPRIAAWKTVLYAKCHFRCPRQRKQMKQNHQLEMSANAQRDGRPAEYRWRPLFNSAKFGWCPLLECRAVTLPRHETRWNLQGCPKLANKSQPLVGRNSLYYQDMCKRYWCLTSFFPIVDTCLSSKDIARQSCAMVPKWRFFASCISSEPCGPHFRPAI